MAETRTMPALGGVYADLRRGLRRRRPRARGPGAWEEIDRAINPSFFSPRLRPDVEFRDFVRRSGERYTMIASPAPMYMRLTEEERFVVDQMNGERTVKEIVVLHFQRYGTFSLSAVADLVAEMHQGGFFTTPYVPVAERAIENRKARASHLPRWVREFARTRRIEFPRAHQFFTAMHRYGGKIFYAKPVGIASVAISVVGLAAFVALLGRGKYSLLGSSAASGVLVLYGIQLFSTFIHESGHAISTVHYGRRVNAAGFMLYLGMPAFFIDTTDTWMLNNRERVVASGAGPFSECIMAGAASVVALAFPASAATAFLFRFAVLSYIAIAENMIPFLRLDGYYVLIDAMDEVNLRERSFEFVREDLWRKIRRRERFDRRERIFTGYGVLAVVFTFLAIGFSIAFWSSIMGRAAERAWRAGLVSRILISLLLLAILGPIARGLFKLLGRGARRVRAMLRRLRRAAQKGWRTEAVELYRGLPLTGELPEEALTEIGEHVELVRVEPGQAIVRQGERGDRFYVVRSGAFEVTRVEDDGTERFVRRAERGRSFGELALLEAAPRTATVRAVERAEAFAIDKGTFDRAIARNIHVADDVRRDLLSAAELRSLQPFQALDGADLARLLNGASWKTYEPGERIVKQGDPGDAFYVVSSGQVEVLENRRVTGRLGSGAYFGEIALLSGAPRTATVRAVTPTRALELDRKAFDKVLAKSFRKGRLAASRALVREWEH